MAAGIASEFTGKIDQFGVLDQPRKRAIRKGLKLMCREIQMGVAAAQLTLQHAGLDEATMQPERTGVVFGCDHIVTLPGEFSDAYEACTGEQSFDFTQWGGPGISAVAPLWLLKYLPNMPASHIAIYNDLQGPNNSITYREASSNLAIGEAMETILRGGADRMLAGATGSSIAPLRAVQLSVTSQWANNGAAPNQLSRPFDKDRSGMVAGEGAGCLLLEELESATARGATIYGEILGHGSSVAVNKNSVADIRQAVANAAKAALRRAGIRPPELGHVHAHGAGTHSGDLAEAQGIHDIVGAEVPVTTAKGAMGNLGAAGGIVELVASLLAMKNGQLFPTVNCDHPDPECPIRIVNKPNQSPGTTVLNLNYTPMGQASAVVATAGWSST